MVQYVLSLFQEKKKSLHSKRSLVNLENNIWGACVLITSIIVITYEKTMNLRVSSYDF